jgi:endonuclease I
LRIARLHDTLNRAPTSGPRELEAAFNALERDLPFNCEHVVPQSWFGQQEPMRGDLHHLFACDPHCNTFRANTPYADLADTDGKAVSDCGHSTAAGFEPGAGKGAVARATLYFLLRYPTLIGDEARELQRPAVPVLMAWHAEHPVGDYERHRNATIAEAQGNRNPLIDFPDIIDRVDFAAAFGR